MSKQKITTINGVDIYAETNENGIFVPVKPICQSIGIDNEGQRRRIARHYISAPVAFTIKATGADGKQYEKNYEINSKY